jgi:hypothetical protein
MVVEPLQAVSRYKRLLVDIHSFGKFIWKVAPCYITVISHLRYITLSEMDITPGKMDITCVI